MQESESGYDSFLQDDYYTSNPKNDAPALQNMGDALFEKRDKLAETSAQSPEARIDSLTAKIADVQSYLTSWTRMFDQKGKSLTSTIACDEKMRELVKKRRDRVEQVGYDEGTSKNVLDEALESLQCVIRDLGRVTDEASQSFIAHRARTDDYLKGELILAKGQRATYDKARKKLLQQQEKRTTMSLKSNTEKEIFHVEKKVNLSKEELIRETENTVRTLDDVTRLNACFEIELVSGIVESFHRLFTDGEAILAPLFERIPVWRDWTKTERQAVAADAKATQEGDIGHDDRIFLEDDLFQKGKARGKSRKWSKRRFVLKPKYLYCFNMKQGKKKVLKDVIHLSHCCVKPGKRRLYAISINYANQTHFISASNEEQYNAWMENLKACIDNYEEHDVVEEAEELMEMEAAQYANPNEEFGAEPHSFVIEKSGILSKKGARRRNWKTRFFHLLVNSKSRVMSYYRDQKPDKSPKGTVNLDFVISVSRHPEREFGFQIVLPDRTYFCSASKKSEMEEWMALIRKSIRYSRYLKNPDKGMVLNAAVLERGQRRNTANSRGGSLANSAAGIPNSVAASSLANSNSGSRFGTPAGTPGGTPTGTPSVPVRSTSVKPSALENNSSVVSKPLPASPALSRTGSKRLPTPPGGAPAKPLPSPSTVSAATTMQPRRPAPAEPGIINHPTGTSSDPKSVPQDQRPIQPKRKPPSIPTSTTTVARGSDVEDDIGPNDSVSQIGSGSNVSQSPPPGLG